MIKYIKITKYTSGCSIKEQVQDIIDNGQMDEDTRLFFNKSNCITTSDIREMMIYFDIITDNDFDDENVVFKPKSFIISVAREGGKL